MECIWNPWPRLEASVWSDMNMCASAGRFWKLHIEVVFLSIPPEGQILSSQSMQRCVDAGTRKHESGMEVLY